QPLLAGGGRPADAQEAGEGGDLEPTAAVEQEVAQQAGGGVVGGLGLAGGGGGPGEGPAPGGGGGGRRAGPGAASGGRGGGGGARGGGGGGGAGQGRPPGARGGLRLLWGRRRVTRKGPDPVLVLVAKTVGGAAMSPPRHKPAGVTRVKLWMLDGVASSDP